MRVMSGRQNEDDGSLDVDYDNHTLTTLERHHDGQVQLHDSSEKSLDHMLQTRWTTRQAARAAGAN